MNKLTKENIENVKDMISKSNIHRKREKTETKEYKGYTYYQIKKNNGLWNNFIYDENRELVAMDWWVSDGYKKITWADKKCIKRIEEDIVHKINDEKNRQEARTKIYKEMKGIKND